MYGVKLCFLDYIRQWAYAQCYESLTTLLSQIDVNFSAFAPVPNYTAWRQRHKGVEKLAKSCYAAVTRPVKLAVHYTIQSKTWWKTQFSTRFSTRLLCSSATSSRMSSLKQLVYNKSATRFSTGQNSGLELNWFSSVSINVLQLRHLIATYCNQTVNNMEDISCRFHVDIYTVYTTLKLVPPTTSQSTTPANPHFSHNPLCSLQLPQLRSTDKLNTRRSVMMYRYWQTAYRRDLWPSILLPSSSRYVLLNSIVDEETKVGLRTRNMKSPIRNYSRQQEKKLEGSLHNNIP